MSGIDRQAERHAEGLSRQVYEKPELSVLALSVVTLGGSPGTGDSGVDPRNPFGGRIQADGEDSPDDSDWGYDY